MAVFVILSLALAFTAIAVMALGGRELWRSLTRLRAVAGQVRERLDPLTQELRDELAVTSAETEALQRSLDTMRDARTQRQRDRESLRAGLKRAVRG